MPLTDRTSAQGVLIGLPLLPDRLRVLGDVLAYHLLDRPLSTCHAVLLQCQPLPFGTSHRCRVRSLVARRDFKGASWP
ncbi:MAG: hypothetical protein ACRDZS_05510 [Acidimicrobiales bacterium]